MLKEIEHSEPSREPNSDAIWFGSAVIDKVVINFSDK